MKYLATTQNNLKFIKKKKKKSYLHVRTRGDEVFGDHTKRKLLDP